MRIEGTFDIALPRAAVYALLTDPGLMAGCIPGCDQIERLSPTEYRARVTVGLGGIKASFNLVVEVTRELPPELILSQTRGEEGSRASMLAADNEVVLVEIDAATTRVNYASDVSVTGRLGKFALGVMKKKVESLGQEFAGRLRDRIRTQPAAQHAALQPPAAALGPGAPADTMDTPSRPGIRT
jgi:hypothetical protein